MDTNFPIRGVGLSPTGVNGAAIDISTVNIADGLVSGNILNLSGMPTVVRLAADVVNAHATPNTIADVTGLSFPVVAGGLYHFDFWIWYTAAATTTGSRWCLNGPTGVLSATSEYSLTGTTTTRNANVVGFDLPAASNATSGATTGNTANIVGIFSATVAGTLTARFASEVTVSAITAKAGSFVAYRRMA